MPFFKKKKKNNQKYSETQLFSILVHYYRDFALSSFA